MAFDLKAVFRVQDKGTATIRRITQEMNKLNRVMKQVERSTNTFGRAQQQVNSAVRSTSNVINRNTSTVNNNTSAVINNVTQINRYSSASRGATASISSQSNALSGLRNMLIGVATAYIGVQGASKAFESTIGAAAKYEQQEIVTRTMFKDDGKAADYMKLMDEMALKSAVLNSNDMMVGSKAYVGLTKDIGQLEKMWNITEKLQAFSGVDTQQASFSLKELLQGDYISIVDAVGMDKKAMQKIVKMDGVDAKITAMSALLDTMGVTDRTLEEMANSTLGQWSAITEKVGVFSRLVGKAPNTKLGDALKEINVAFDKINTDVFAKKVGDVLGTGLGKVVNFTKKLWEMREPIMAGAKAASILVGALAGIFAITTAVAVLGFSFGLLTSPIAIAVLGVFALVKTFKSLHDNSEAFRNSVDKATSKISELYGSFKGSGTFDKLKDSAETIADTITTLLAPAVKSVMDYIGNIDVKAVTEGLNGAIDSATEFINKIINGIPAAISAVAGITAAVLTFKTAMAGMAIVGTVTTLINAYRAGTLTATLATLGFNTALFANPVGLVIAAISALVGVIVVLALNWDTVKAKTVAVWEAIGGLQGAIALILGPIGFLINAAMDLAKNWDSTKSVWENVWSSIQRSAATSVNAVIGLINEMIATINKIPGVNIPIVAKVDWGQATSRADFRKVDGSHYNGIGRIPKNNYLANLHIGEKVLTRFEADKYDDVMSGEMQVAGVSDFKHTPSNTTYNTTNHNNTVNGSREPRGERAITINPTFNMPGMVIREDADIRKLSDAVTERIVEQVLVRRGVTS